MFRYHRICRHVALGFAVLVSLFLALACATVSNPEPDHNIATPLARSPTAANASIATAPPATGTPSVEGQPPAETSVDPPAFPGAEGFGATATGGRGGQVLYVTTLAADPKGEIPGSLNWALRQEGPRYISK